MAKKKGERLPRGAQVGNVSAVRTASGRTRAYLKRGALRPEDGWVLGAVKPYADGLFRQVGQNATAAEVAMVELACVARACLLLALSSGPEGRVEAAKWVAQERLALESIGLSPKPAPVTDLGAYLRALPARVDVVEGEVVPPKAAKVDQ